MDPPPHPAPDPHPAQPLAEQNDAENDAGGVPLERDKDKDLDFSPFMLKAGLAIMALCEEFYEKRHEILNPADPRLVKTEPLLHTVMLKFAGIIHDLRWTRPGHYDHFCSLTAMFNKVWNSPRSSGKL